MITRKRLIVLVVILGLVTLSLVLLRHFNSQQPETNTPQNARDVSVALAALDNKSSMLDPSDNDAVKEVLNGIIFRNVIDASGAYDTKYREGSLQETITPNGVPLVRFIVDVPKLERTFVIKIEGGGGAGYRTMHALCPEPRDLVYGAKECKDTP